MCGHFSNIHKVPMLRYIYHQILHIYSSPGHQNICNCSPCNLEDECPVRNFGNKNRPVNLIISHFGHMFDIMWHPSTIFIVISKQLTIFQMNKM